ncbi:hypothetical protein [Bradyrhizobium sp. McL0615]|uniref:hypothetical protein n=1 Tax=Bradyrhizobium sp. McL0615 TaxID=3415673 RepID=UPI003CEA7562
MRRILEVDDRQHTRLAIGIWLKQCGFREREGKYGLSCQGEAMRHSLLSSP